VRLGEAKARKSTLEAIKGKGEAVMESQTVVDVSQPPIFATTRGNHAAAASVSDAPCS
jgi:hypothetical protein